MIYFDNKNQAHLNPSFFIALKPVANEINFAVSNCFLLHSTKNSSLNLLYLVSHTSWRFFFWSNATTCPCGLRDPPSWAWQECNFWCLEAHEAQLRCPDDVSGDIRGCSARRALKPKFYPTYPDHGHRGNPPLQGKFPRWSRESNTGPQD